jgi:serine/threonine-protein kinase
MSNLPERLAAVLEDRYTLEREIGRGGMATVYLATDRKHERQVAIKVLHPDLVSHGYHPERFLREIRIIASLTHPQILPLHDSDECEGFLYYIMPFVAGGSLRHRLERDAPLPVDDTIVIARAVAAALDYAHRHDVLHRDIKPENILFNEGQPVIADFGVARAISICCDDLTAAGIAIGTPAYMSPEQATGDENLDARSDLYALACVVYEMLTGTPPFTGANARQTMARQALEPPPSVRAPRPDVPPGVEGAILRALAKDPEDRFPTTVEFAEALSAPTSGAEHLFPAPDARRTIAVLPFVNASPDPENEYLSDGITDELINALAKVEGLHIASRTSVFALKGSARDVRSIGALLNVSAILEGTLRKADRRLRITAQLTNVADGRLLWSERYDREIEDVFAVEDEIARTIVETLRTTLLGDLGELVSRRYTENVVAYNLYLKGRYFWNQRTQAGIAQAIECFEQAIAEDPEYALAYSGLADCHAIQVDYRGIPAAEGMQRAKAEARKALELDETLAEAHTSLAWVTFIYEWDWALAEAEFRRAIDLNPRYATARQWHAWLLTALGRTEEALAEGRAALEFDPASVSVRRSMGWLYYYARRYDTAVEHLQRALTMDPTSSENHRVLGLAHTQRGAFDAAETALRQALATHLGAKESPYVVAALGYLAARRGDGAAAEERLRELEDRVREQYVSPVALVTILVGLGRVDEALGWLERAHEERRGWLAYLTVEPLLDPLRGHPRFAALIRKMRLEG